MPVFATPEPITVTLDLIAADVRLRAGDGADTVVTIGPRDPSNAEDAKLAERTHAEFTDGRLEIRTPRSWRGISPFRSGGALDIEIELPAGSEVRGEASMAEVHATGPLGPCRFTASVCDLIFDRTGPATLSTNRRVNGDVDIRRPESVR